MIVGRQVRREKLDGREVDGARVEQGQDRGETPHRPGGRHAVVGLVLGEDEYASTVSEERPMAGPQMCVPRIELREVRDQEGGGTTLTSRNVLDPRHEFRVGEPTE